MSGAGTASGRSRKCVAANQLPSVTWQRTASWAAQGSGLALHTCRWPACLQSMALGACCQTPRLSSHGLTAEQTACTRAVLGGPGHVAT